jgi:hypothetical protein
VKETRFRDLVIREAGSHAHMLCGGRCRTVLKGCRQIKRAKDICALMAAKEVDFAVLDERFFAVLSLYLCEERDCNAELLYAELRRLP